jgi:hypothetical protein
MGFKCSTAILPDLSIRPTWISATLQLGFFQANLAIFFQARSSAVRSPGTEPILGSVLLRVIDENLSARSALLSPRGNEELAQSG